MVRQWSRVLLPESDHGQRITDANKQLQINGALTSFNLVTNVFFSFFVDN
jgi:hypothetical protein